MYGGISNDKPAQPGKRGTGMTGIRLLAAAVLLALAGCNTVAGVGEDISGSARAVGNMMGG